MRQFQEFREPGARGLLSLWHRPVSNHSISPGGATSRVPAAWSYSIPGSPLLDGAAGTHRNGGLGVRATQSLPPVAARQHRTGGRGAFPAAIAPD